MRCEKKTCFPPPAPPPPQDEAFPGQCAWTTITFVMDHAVYLHCHCHKRRTSWCSRPVLLQRCWWWRRWSRELHWPVCWRIVGLGAAGNTLVTESHGNTGEGWRFMGGGGEATAGIRNLISECQVRCLLDIQMEMSEKQLEVGVNFRNCKLGLLAAGLTCLVFNSDLNIRKIKKIF